MDSQEGSPPAKTYNFSELKQFKPPEEYAFSELKRIENKRGGRGKLIAAAIGVPAIAGGLLFEAIKPNFTASASPDLARPALTALATPDSPTATATNVPAREVKTVESDFVRDIAKSLLLPEAKKRRLEKTKSDPEYLKRIDPELNTEDSINFLITGLGSEGWGQEKADTIIPVNYNLKPNKMSLISLHRDTQAPEIYKKAQAKGHPINWYDTEIMNAIDTGGMDFLEQIVESSTGLSMDFRIKLKRDALPAIIDDVFGKVKINVEQDIPPDTENGIPGFNKGEQEMDGKSVLNYSISRVSTSVERRNSAQQQVIDIIIGQFLDHLATKSAQDNVAMLYRLKTTLGKLNTTGLLETNIPLDQIMDQVIEQLPKLTLRYGLNKLAGNNRQSLFVKPSETHMSVEENKQINRFDPNKTGPRKALMGYVDPTTGKQIEVDLTTATTESLIAGYYKNMRELVKKLILG